MPTLCILVCWRETYLGQSWVDDGDNLLLLLWQDDDVIESPLVVVLPGEHRLPPAEPGTRGLGGCWELQIDKSTQKQTLRGWKSKAVLFVKAGKVTKAETREGLVLFDPLAFQRALRVDTGGLCNKKALSYFVHFICYDVSTDWLTGFLVLVLSFQKICFLIICGWVFWLHVCKGPMCVCI